MSKGVTSPSRPGGRPAFLSDLVVELGMVDAHTVEDAVNAARTSGRKAERILVEVGALTEDQLARATAERYGLDHIDLAEYEVHPAAANLIDPGAAKRYQAVPVSFTDDGALVVAMADPSDGLGMNDIAVMTKLAVRPVVASRTDIEALQERLPLPPVEGQAPPPMPVAAPAEDEAEEHSNGSSGAKPSQPPAEIEPTAVFWQPDGESAPAPAAPAATADPAQADALRARLEEEHQRALEALKQEYESKLRGQERTVAELMEELEAERARRDRAIGKVRDELEAEKSELERAVRNLESGIETSRAEAERAALALRSELDTEKAVLEQTLRELRTDLEAERYQHERAIGDLRGELQREREQHRLGVEELTRRLTEGDEASQTRLVELEQRLAEAERTAAEQRERLEQSERELAAERSRLEQCLAETEGAAAERAELEERLRARRR